jgi:hypothetical protein
LPEGKERGYAKEHERFVVVVKECALKARKSPKADEQSRKEMQSGIKAAHFSHPIIATITSNIDTAYVFYQCSLRPRPSPRAFS